MAKGRGRRGMGVRGREGGGDDDVKNLIQYFRQSLRYFISLSLSLSFTLSFSVSIILTSPHFQLPLSFLLPLSLSFSPHSLSLFPSSSSISPQFSPHVSISLSFLLLPLSLLLFQLSLYHSPFSLSSYLSISLPTPFSAISLSLSSTPSLAIFLIPTPFTSALPFPCSSHRHSFHGD